MKPNFAKKSQIGKGKNNNEGTISAKINTIPEQNNESIHQDLGQSLVGEREYIYFKDHSAEGNPSLLNNSLSGNVSLVGSSEKVYFTNSSKLIQEEFEKDKKLYDELNAFKPNEKVKREPEINNNYNKAKSEIPIQNKQSSQHLDEEDDNEFLELNQVGKWQKSNKSTVISEEMKKIQTHYQNRLTETKWIKKNSKEDKKSSKQQGKPQTQKNVSLNSSSCQNQSSFKKDSVPSNISSFLKQNTSKLSANKQMSPKKIEIKKVLKEQPEEIAEDNNLNNLSVKEQQYQKDEQIEMDGEEQVEDQHGQNQEDSKEEQQEEDQSEEQEEQQEQESDEQEEAQEEQEEEQEEQEEQEKSQQEQQQQEEEQEQEEEQKQEESAEKAKKWGSRENINANNSNAAGKNSSIKVEKNNQSQMNEEEQIQDLTEGEIPGLNDQPDEQWDKLQKILLRIQNLVI